MAHVQNSVDFEHKEAERERIFSKEKGFAGVARACEVPGCAPRCLRQGFRVRRRASSVGSPGGWQPPPACWDQVRGAFPPIRRARSLKAFDELSWSYDFESGAVRKVTHLVVLENSLQISLWIRRSVPMQPRTGPSKFANI